MFAIEYKHEFIATHYIQAVLLNHDVCLGIEGLSIRTS
jgi:hypothetical protein